MLHDAMELIDSLTREALGMTGKEALDQARIERGAGYVRDFQIAFPLLSGFIQMFLYGTPEMALASLAAWQPSVNDWTDTQKALAKTYLAEVQKRLKK